MGAEDIKNKQEKQKAETIYKIKRTIEFIRKNEGDNAIITPSKLMLYAKISRSVLYKSHILKIWKPELWEKRYGIRGQSNKYYEKELIVLQEANTELSKRANKFEVKNKDLERRIIEEETLYKAQKIENKRIEEINSLLRGEILDLQSKLTARGITH